MNNVLKKATLLTLVSLFTFGTTKTQDTDIALAATSKMSNDLAKDITVDTLGLKDNRPDINNAIKNALSYFDDVLKPFALEDKLNTLALSTTTPTVELASTTTKTIKINDKALSADIVKSLEDIGINKKKSTQTFTKEELNQVMVIRVSGKEDLSELCKLHNLSVLEIYSDKSLKNLNSIKDNLPYSLNCIELLDCSLDTLKIFKDYWMFGIQFNERLVSNPREFFKVFSEMKRENYNINNIGLLDIHGLGDVEELLSVVKFTFKNDKYRKAVSLAITDNKYDNRTINFGDTFNLPDIMITKEICDKAKLTQKEREDLIVTLLNTNIGIPAFKITDSSINITKMIEDGRINKNQMNVLVINDYQLSGEYRYEFERIFDLEDYPIHLTRGSIEKYQTVHAQRLDLIKAISDKIEKEYPNYTYAARLATCIAGWDEEVNLSDLDSYIKYRKYNKDVVSSETKDIEQAKINNALKYMERSGIDAKIVVNSKTKQQELHFTVEGKSGSWNPKTDKFVIDGLTEHEIGAIDTNIQNTASNEIFNLVDCGNNIDSLDKLNEDIDSYYFPSKVTTENKPKITEIKKDWDIKEQSDWAFKPEKMVSYEEIQIKIQAEEEAEFLEEIGLEEDYVEDYSEN